MKRVWLLFFSGVILAAGCVKDKREVIFDMIYPNFDFELPAGLNPSFAAVIEFPSVSSNIADYLKDNNTDTSAIAAIRPNFARILSQSGRVFDFLEEVSVRICPVGQDCSEFDEIFYLDDMTNRQYNTIELLPTLRNSKKLLSGARFRLEVVFFLSEISPFLMECQMDMGLQAVR